MLQDRYMAYTVFDVLSHTDDTGSVTMTPVERGRVMGLVIHGRSDTHTIASGMQTKGMGQLIHDPSVLLPPGTLLKPDDNGPILLVTGDDRMNRTPMDADEPAALVQVEWQVRA